MKMWVTYTSFFLTAGMIALLIFLLWLNSFSKETFQFIYPVLGALFVSIVLTLKSLLYDGPEPIDITVPIILTIDINSGSLYSSPPKLWDNPTLSLSKRFGVSTIEKLHNFNSFKEIDFSKPLIEPTAKSPSPDWMFKRNSLLLEAIEYSILQWLLGFPIENTITFVGGSSGSIDSMLPPGAQRKKIEINNANFPGNRFITLWPLQGSLPPGTTVSIDRAVDKKSYNASSLLKIETSNSVIQFKIFLTTSHYFKPTEIRQMENLGIKHGKLRPGLPENHVFNQIQFDVEYIGEVLPLRRFSHESKLHQRWLEQIQKIFPIDFSDEDYLRK